MFRWKETVGVITDYNISTAQYPYYFVQSILIIEEDRRLTKH